MNQPNFIEHEEDGRVFIIPELVMLDNEAVDDFLERKRDPINRAILVAIKLMIKLEMEVVPVFAVEDVEVIFNLSRDEAKENMENYISYFTEIEEYENCRLLLNLKTKL
jgi:hypothetical protein